MSLSTQLVSNLPGLKTPFGNFDFKNGYRTRQERSIPSLFCGCCAFAATHQTGVLCYDSRMRGLADIHLDVRGGDIIVDLPGTSYTVTYHKPAVSRQLLAAYQPAKDDARTGLTQAEFLARAWRLANDKAREMEWIV
jgi:hypothetical protein